MPPKKLNKHAAAWTPNKNAAAWTPGKSFAPKKKPAPKPKPKPKPKPAPTKKSTKTLSSNAAAWTPSFGASSYAQARPGTSVNAAQRFQHQNRQQREQQQRRARQEAERQERERQERERKEAEAKKAEEERKRKQEEERIRQEEAKKKAEEEKRLEEERIRQEEAKRKAEEEEMKRLAEERRQEEERMKAEEEEKRKREEQERERQKRKEELKKQREDDKDTSTKDRKYSRMFLLKFEKMCTLPPEGLDPKFKASMSRDSGRYSSRSSDKFRTVGGGGGGGGGGDKWRNSNATNPRSNSRRQYGGNNDRYNNDRYNNNNNDRYNNNNRRNNNRRGQKGRRNNNRNQNSRPMDIEIKDLEVTENRYKIARNKAELEEDEKLKREINSLLNKLTPEKFDKLCKQFDELEVNNLDRLNFVVNSVFEKALINPIHTPTYAEFCKRLALKGQKFEGNTTFKKILLNCCQTEFERDHDEDRKILESKQTEEEKLEFEIKFKQRRLGTIAFIGELFCRGLIGKKIIYVCFNYLLDPENPDEENIEALCKLFVTIGKALWAKERNSQQKHGKFTLNLVYSLVSKNLIKRARIRFLIQDTTELASRGWIQRKAVKTVEAKKISDIHAEAEKEAALAAEQNRRTNYRRDRDRDRRRNDTRNTAPQHKRYHNNSNRTKKPKNRDADGWSSTNVRARTGRSGRGSGNTLSMRGGRTPRNTGRRTPFNRRPQPTPVIQVRQKSAFELLGEADESEESARSATPSPQAASVNSPTNDLPDIQLESAMEEKLKPEEEKKKRRFIKGFIEEYFGARDMEEVKLCITELGTRQLHHYIVFGGMCMAFEKKMNDRECFKTFLTTLAREQVLLKHDLVKGFDEMMEYYEDFAMDLPILYKILSDWLASVFLIEPASITLGYLNSTALQKLSASSRKKFVVATLEAILKATNQDKLTALATSDADFDVNALDIELPDSLSFLK